MLRLAHLLCDDEDKMQKIADLVSYIENNRDGLYGSKSLMGKVGGKNGSGMQHWGDGEKH